MQRAEYNNARLICYYTILPHLKPGDQKKPVDKIVPDSWEDRGKERAVKSLKEVFEERMVRVRKADERRKKKNA